MQYLIDNVGRFNFKLIRRKVGVIICQFVFEFKRITNTSFVIKLDWPVKFLNVCYTNKRLAQHITVMNLFGNFICSLF